MAKKAALSLRIAPLQRVIAEPITDAAEQAAVDKALKRIKRMHRGRNTDRHRSKATSSSATRKRK